MTASAFKISSGQSFNILTQTAEVVAKENLKSFDFSQSGGGGYVGPYGGTIDAPKIHVHENNTDRIWLRDKQGNEYNLDLTNIDLPVREGQILTQYFISTDGAKHDRRVGVRNNTTGQYVDLARYSSVLVDKTKNWKTPFFSKLCIFIFACLIVPWAYIYFTMNPDSVSHKGLPYSTCSAVLQEIPDINSFKDVRQALKAQMATRKENYQRHSACLKSLPEKERVEYETKLKKVDAENQSMPERTAFYKSWYDLLPVMGWLAVAALIVGVITRRTSRTAYGDRLASETVANTRKVLTA